MKVKDPSGQNWRVTRRWVPWRRRVKVDLDAMPDGPGNLGDDPISLIIGLVFLVIMLPFLLLGLIALLEVLVLFLVLPFAFLARVLFGRHWIVEAREGFTIRYDEPAGDWQASGVRIHALADEIRQGRLPSVRVADSS